MASSNHKGFIEIFLCPYVQFRMEAGGLERQLKRSSFRGARQGVLKPFEEEAIGLVESLVALITLWGFQRWGVLPVSPLINRDL